MKTYMNNENMKNTGSKTIGHTMPCSYSWRRMMHACEHDLHVDFLAQEVELEQFYGGHLHVMPCKTVVGDKDIMSR